MKKVVGFLVVIGFLSYFSDTATAMHRGSGSVSADEAAAAATAASLPHRVADEGEGVAAAAAAASSTAAAASSTSSLEAEAPLRLIDILITRLTQHLAKRRVLALDGGGVRGAFTARVLEHIEEKTGLPIYEIFQGSITGTSTGSLIALGLTSPDKNGQADTGPYTAAEIVQFYRNRASRMFSGCCAADNCVRSLRCPAPPVSRLGCFVRSIFSCFGCCGCCYNCNGVCGPRYTRKALDGELKSLLGTTRRLKDALGPVQVVTYDIGRGGGIRHLSSTDTQTNQYPSSDAGAASSAAPTYFPAAVIGDGSAATPERVCVDGGLFENNPVLSALRQAKATLGNDHDISDFTIVSVGTGVGAGAFSDEALQHAGALAWAAPAIEIAMEGTSAATDRSFTSLFPSGNYFRLQTPLSPSLLEMDNPDNVPGLFAVADRFCGTEDQSCSFNRFLARLEEERDFMDNLRREYGSLDNRELISILRRFEELVGITHKETEKNIERLRPRDAEDTFTTQVLRSFNNLTLLRALRIVIHEAEQILDLMGR